MDSADEIALQLLAKPLALAVALSLIAALAISLTKPWRVIPKRYARNVQRLFVLTAPVVFLGFVCGYLSGASREAAIGTLITSALTLVGGVGLFLFQGKTPHMSKHVGFTVFAFASSIFFGVENGAYDREFRQADRFNKLAEQEARIRIYRRNLQLPEEPPNWISGTPPEKNSIYPSAPPRQSFP